MRNFWWSIGMMLVMTSTLSCDKSPTAPTRSGSTITFKIGSTCSNGTASLYIDDSYETEINANGGQSWGPYNVSDGSHTYSIQQGTTRLWYNQFTVNGTDLTMSLNCG